jgi:phage terminase large subunit GpA-like protein
MKRLISAEALAEIAHYKNVLEQNGIPCFIKNEQLSGALGELPFLECLPELWVLRDGDLEAAERILGDLRREGVRGQSWRCRHCGEENEAQFAACWSCGRPDERG